MNRTTKLLTLSVAAIVVLSLSPHAYAICPVSQPAQHLFGGFIDGCPDAKPVGGFVGVVGAAAANNSGNIDIVCEAGNIPGGQGPLCQPDAGGAGDNIVTILYDWSNLGGPLNTVQPTGCPNASGLAGVGRNFWEIVCNNGASAIFSVGYDIGSAGYPIELAQPLAPFPAVHLGANTNGLSLAQFTRAGGNDTACINQQTTTPTSGPIALYTDCDSGAVSGGLCPEGPPDFQPIAITPGANIYMALGCSQVSTGACSAAHLCFDGTACNADADCVGTLCLTAANCGNGLCQLGGARKPTDLVAAHWTVQTTTSGPTGSRCVTYPTPAAGRCNYIGSTLVLNGSDTGAISGSVEVCAGDPTAATDKVKIDSAAFTQGKLRVAFSTENETLIVGFNVYAGSTKLNTGLIAAKGTGNNAYPFEVGRGAVKANKTVTVEAVKSDGTVVKTAPVNVK